MLLCIALGTLAAQAGAAPGSDEAPGSGSSASPPAAAPDTQQCLASYTDAQRLRQAGQLTAAREQLLLCARDSCPAVVQADCVPWLADTERAIPTLVIDARDTAGKDTTAVRVSIDGKLVAARLDGRPLALDPGPHKLTFEHAGVRPIHQEIVAQVGVKNRRVQVDFGPTGQSGPGAGGKDGATPPPAERSEPIVGYVLTGVGVLALGSFAVFGLIGKSEADEYDETCAPTKTCDPDEVSATETKLLVADISLLVGVAATGVGVGLILYNKLSDPEPSGASAQLRLAPLAGGAGGQLRLRF